MVCRSGFAFKSVSEIPHRPLYIVTTPGTSTILPNQLQSNLLELDKDGSHDSWLDVDEIIW